MTSPMQLPTPHKLPQLNGSIYLTEAGFETDLVFHHGIELPDFATFPLLESPNGRRTVAEYYQRVTDLARRVRTGAVLETLTWRANRDWGARLGYGTDQLDMVNRDAVKFFQDLRAANPDVSIVISGNIGPRGDGYVTNKTMSAAEAADYHAPQIHSLHMAGANLVTAMTLNYSEEATGIVAAARAASAQVAISFTLETDGALPSGQSLADAIAEVDESTDQHAAYFMINCAHPDHFFKILAGDGPWDRVRGIRANASRLSHAELDQAEVLDRGDEAELAASYRLLPQLLPNLAVVGGCCGTDLHHLQAICDAFHPGSLAPEKKVAS